jgi:hypothetical protein
MPTLEDELVLSLRSYRRLNIIYLVWLFVSNIAFELKSWNFLFNIYYVSCVKNGLFKLFFIELW